MSTAVVYLHGLWLSGIEGGLLRRRLARDLGAATSAFSYHSVTADATSNARLLAAHLARIDADTLHLVGHSLGGIVILKMFESDTSFLPPGRIVMLGSPLNGCRTAHRLARFGVGRRIMGVGVREELLMPHDRCWTGQRDLGVIAGDLSVGLGRLVMRSDAPGDGTIFVDETRLPGISEHLVVHVSHMGLPFSKHVARQTAAFLKDGRFVL